MRGCIPLYNELILIKLTLMMGLSLILLCYLELINHIIMQWMPYNQIYNNFLTITDQSRNNDINRVIVTLILIISLSHFYSICTATLIFLS